MPPEAYQPGELIVYDRRIYTVLVCDKDTVTVNTGDCFPTDKCKSRIEARLDAEETLRLLDNTVTPQLSPLELEHRVNVTKAHKLGKRIEERLRERDGCPVGDWKLITTMQLLPWDRFEFRIAPPVPASPADLELINSLRIIMLDDTGEIHVVRKNFEAKPHRVFDRETGTWV